MAKKGKHKKRYKNKAELEAVEPRLLFSAGLEGVLAAEQLEAPTDDYNQTVIEQTIDSGTAAASEASAADVRVELIFVDTDTPEYQTLLSDLLTYPDDSIHYQVFELDNTEDGIAQITATLSGFENVNAIHILSHGTEGAIDLGGSTLDAETLAANAELVGSWGSALTEDADILIYGCDLAATSEGEMLVNSLATLTGADVAASDDLTGNAALGGDWELEYHQGAIETSVAISSQAQQNWLSVLNFIVNTNADTVDANPGDTLAEDGSGNTSLRAAIEESNVLGGADVITLAADTYSLSLGELQISSDITINGAGVDQTFIDGATLSRIFNITSGTVTFNNLTIQDGDAGAGQGGGINVGSSATAIMTNVKLTGNTSVRGGAINNDGILNLTDVTIDNNLGTSDAGAIFNTGVTTLNNVTISNNTGNSNAGGVWTQGAGSDFIATNVTFSGNTTPGNGGGMYIAKLATLTNVTITNNSAGQGSGIHETGGGATTTITNSIIAGNLGSADISGSYISGGNNLIGNKGSASGFTDGVNGDQVGDAVTPIDPLLGALADNGGPTLSHALLTGSTAIDGGTNTGAPATDQRGTARDATTDIGAYEYGVVFNTAPVLAADSYSVDEDTTLVVNWWNTDWTARQQLTFNNLAQTENLVDFPVLVVINSGNIDYTKTQDNGADLRFFDTDGTALAHEIEIWNESGDSYVWVKVPQINGSSNADYISMYYGNASAADGQNATSVWTNGYAGVWHMDDDPSLGADAIDDSSANPLDGTATNMDGTNLVAGKVGGALSFDGSSESIRIDSTATDKLAITGTQITIEAWVKRDGSTGSWMIMVGRQLGNDSSDSYFTATKYDAPDTLVFGHDGTSAQSAGAVPDATWKYITAVQDGADLLLYSNGVLVGSTTGAGAITTDNNDVTIGGAENDATSTITEFFKGLLDEVRISDVARSADWVAAQHASMDGTFVAFGGEEPAPAIGGVMANDTDADGNPLTAILVSGPSNAASFTFNADGTFTYTPTADFNGIDTFTYKVNDGTEDSNTATVTITVNSINDAPVLDDSEASLWLSTEADVAGSAAPGLSNWTDGEMLQFGATDLSFGENTTSGTFSSTGFNLDAFAGGDADIDGLHYVTQTVTVGSGANSLDLLAGDLLLSTATAETLTSSNTLAVGHEDVFVFRPDTPGDYTSGTFIFLLDNPFGGGLKGVTLVEQDTTVGDVTLEAGSFVLSKGDKNLYHFTADTISLTTTGSLTTLIEGADLGLDGAGANIIGVALVQSPTTTGGVTLNSGQLLVTLVGEDNNVGGLDTERRDVITLTITQTGINTLGSAALLFDGDDVNLSSNNESLDALTLVTQAAFDPIVEDISDGANTGTLVSDLVANLISDVEGDPDGIAVTGVDDANGTWQYTTDGGGSWLAFGGVTDASAVLLGTGANDLIRFVPDADWNGSATIDFRAWDSSDGGTSGDTGVDASTNGGDSAFSTQTATGLIEVRAVNDDPVHTVPGSQWIDEDTTLVFSSGNGNLIAVSDDAVDGELEVTLSVTQGTLTLTQTTGLIFTAGADGSASMTFRGLQADINAALDGLSYLGNLNYSGADSLTINTSDLGHEGTGGTLTDNDVVSITVNAINDAPELDDSEANLWLSSAADVSGSGAPGLDSWSDDSILAFGDPNLALEPGTTDGTFSSVVSQLDVLAGANVEINALHRVTSTVTVGGDTQPAFTLQRGDLLLSTRAGHTFTGLSTSVTVAREDVFVFRPQAPGDYSNGEFYMLLDNALGGADIRAVTLAESEVTVGDYTLQAGDFLLVGSGGAIDKDVTLFRADDVGTGTTSGTTLTLLDDVDAGYDVNVQIHGLTLVQHDTTIGGASLSSGTLLMTANATGTVGGNSLSVERYDVFSLEITQTTLVAGAGNAQATATLLFQGADVSLDSASEDLDALTLFTRATFDSIVEDISDGANTGTLVSDLINNLITDVDADPEGIAVTGVDDTNGTWQYTTDGGSSWLAFGGVTDSSAVLLGTGANDLIRFVPDTDWNGNATIDFRAWDSSDGGTSGDTGVDTSTNGGDSAFSSATASGLITVRAVNDTPLASDDAYATNEDSALTTGNVLSNDSGIGDAPAIITTFDATSVNGGTVTYNGDGTFDYVPATNFNGSDSFTYTVTDKDGETSTATVNITVNPVNDAPVLDTAGTATLTQINENDINSSGDSVSAIIASAGGDPITDIDTTAVEGIAITWADNSNGTWQYSTDGGGTWYDIGAASDTSAFLLTDDASNRIRFVPVENFNGTAQFNYQAWDRTDGTVNATAGVDVSTNGGATAYSTTTEMASITIQPVQMVMYLSTSNDVSLSGAPGLDTWSAGEVLALGDPNINLEPGTTDGTLYRFLDLRDFDTGSVEPKVDGIHHVSKNITIGGDGGPAMDLFVGDVLFAINSNSTRLTGSDMVEITTNKKSLFMFRPDTVGDYSSGTFSVVLDNFSTNEVEGISLVEVDTMVGDTLLTAGSFLYNPGNSTNIHLYTVNGTGEGTTSGVSKILITGTDISMGNASAKVSGLDLVESSIEIGNTSLAAGNILVTLDGNDAGIGTNNLSITSNDVFFLDVSTTTLGPAYDETGTSTANAYLLAEGADLNLDTSDEEITAISLDLKFGSGNEDPDISFPGSSVSYTENDPATLLDNGATVSDVDSFNFASGILRVDFVAGGTDADRLAIRNQGSGAGQVGVVGNTVTYAGVTIGTFIGGTSGSDPLVITFNSNADSAKVQAVLSNITYENVSDDPSTTPRDVRVVLTDGDGGTSNVEYKTINVSALNDGPAIGTNTGMTVAEGSTGTVITALMLNEADPDDSGSGVTYTVTAVPLNGTLYLSGVALVDNNTFTQADIDGGLVTYDHDDSQNLSDGFTFSLADGGENGSTPLTGQVFSITVTNVNDAPVLAAIGDQSVNETVNLSFTATATDVDVPADTLTFSLDAASLALGMTIDANTGVFNWTPTEGQGGLTPSVTVTVTDDGTGSLVDSETFTLTVNDINVAPVLGAIGDQSVNELVNLSFTATATDTDLPADTLTFSLDAASLALGMTIDANTGVFSWTPTEGQGGLTPSVTVTVTDDGTGNLVDSETFTITVADVNVAPVLGAIGDQSVNELVNLSFTATATDSDLPVDTLSFSLDAASLALGMTIDANTGVFNWAPTEGQGGLTPSVTVTVTDDGTGNLVDSETFTITVGDVNVAPVLAAIGDQSVNELVNLSFTATATDSDLPADTLTFSLDAASLALGMTIDANTGVFSWTPTEAQGGLTPSVTVTVTDDGTGNLVDSETFTVTVNDVNVAPVLGAIGDQSVNELVNLSFTATATDSDLPADTLTFSLDAASLALGMTIDANTGVFSWTPTEVQDGVHSVNITVTDDGTGTLADSETFDITVNDINTAPVLGAIGDQSVNELVNLSFTATATDSDLPADTLTFSLDAASLALGMTIDANTGVFSWTPTEVQDGVHSVNITVTDDGTGALADSETFDVTVNDINVAPVLGAIGDQSVNELVNLSFTATATDSDLPADTLTYSLDATSLALGMTIDANTGVFSWTPTEGQGGLTPSVTVTVTDDGTGNLVDSETFTITVGDVNVAPVLAAIGDQSVNELVNLSFTATATDSDLPADTLTYSLDAASLALGMTIDANTGVFNWTPTEGQGGLTPSVTVTVTDDGTGNLVDSETFTITVGDVNVAPVLAAIGDQSVNELVNLSFTATATDSDLPADTLTFSLDAASLALGMTIDANTGVFSWTPTEGQGGTTPSVTVTVTDDGTGNLVDSETFTVTVGDVNVAPVLATIGDQSVNELVNLSFTATATDSDLPADTLTFSLDAASLALGMTIDANTGVFNWTPTEGQGGTTPSVTVTVTDDGTGNLVDSETFTVTVGDVNVAPVLAAIGDQSVNELVNLSFTATATDSDLPADTLTYSLDAASLALGMTIDANTGVFSWTPTEVQDGVHSVNITVTDDGTGALADSETFDITVNDINVAPVLGAIGDQSVNELVNLSFTATATDSDMPADNLTYSLDAASLALGMTIDVNTGVFSWTPTEVQDGVHSVSITVTDDGTGTLTDSEIFDITVNEVNVAPVLAAIGDKSVDELVNLTFTASATDADLPANNLTYSLDAASLALGMTIDANTGVFSWTPTEAQGGLTPSVTITVTDDGTGNLVDSETITITVNDINVAPVLGAIGDQSIDELANLTFTATATDSDQPADNLTFSLDAASLALGMTIDANTGVFSWTPTEAQGGLTPSVTITVTDDGTGNLVDSETFTITVNDVNAAPVLGAIGDQSVNELVNLSFTATATDADLPVDNLTFSLDAASLALGMTIDANTGVFNWTPTEGQGGTTPSVTVTVTDDGTGNLVDSETFTITVGDVNVAPVLGAIGDQSVNELVNLSFTATATDSDLPADNLTFGLDAASLALGMTIDANTGVFNWTPTEGQGGTTPSVTVTVTDDGTGNLVDSETFTVTVGDVNTAPVLGAIGDQSVNELVNLSFTATATDSDLPADNLTFSLDAASLALGMTIDANTGVFNWTPTEGQGGTTPSVTVTVTDDGTGNLVDSETFTVTVGDVNTAPVLGAIGDQSVNELVNLSFTATATDSDLPADTLTYNLDAASLALGMTIDANTGVFNWTPTEGQGGLTPSVIVTVTDDGTGNLVDSETFTITVGDVNVAPVLGAIGDQSVNELVNLSFTAAATDSDLPADTLTFSLDAASLALGMTIDANTGVFSWTPTEGQGGTTPSVTVTVTDDGTGNLVDSETFTITVGDVNVAPVLAAIGDQSVNELVNLSFTATATDSDLPADTLTYSLDAASLALGMTIDANTGVFSWTPTEVQDGVHSVNITVTDDGTGTLADSETFDITVNDINTAPVLGAIGDQSVNELVNLSFTATATDSDLPADTLTFSLDAASLALGMTIDANTGVFSWTPTEVQDGVHSVNITVTDDGTGALADSETFDITVNDINVAPVLGAIGDQSVNELVNLSFTATATDSDLPADTLTYSLDAASLALGMTIDANTGVFSWTPTEGQGGLTPSVTVTVTDDGTGNLVDSETFTITVGDVNVAPVLGAIGDQSVNELVNLSFTATATDSDLPADTLTYSLDAASLALGMTIDANTGVFSWTPTEVQDGVHSVNITVTDDGTGTLADSETFDITVNDINTAPVLGAIGDQSVNELVNLSFTATATDSDLPADNLTFTLDAASLALGMTIDANTGVFSWTPTEVQDGVHSVNITVTDDGTGALADSETFDITVNDINVAPVLGAIGDQSVNELVNLSFTATATDSDLPADTLTYSLDAASLALGMTIDANTGVFSWTPTEGQGGLTPSVTVTVTDDGTGNLVDSETFTITVADVNVAPVLAPIGNQGVNELVNLTFTATATDSDLPADTLIFSLDAASLALGMTIDASTGVFSWTPTEAQGGLTPSVTITVTDDGTGNLLDSETFTILVNPTNVAPVLGAIGDQSVNELVNLSFTATATDSDLPSDTLTFSLDAASLALGMTIDANTGVFNWTPTEGQGGTTPSVTVTVTDDGTGNLVDSETFTITVGDVNVAPVLDAIGDQSVNELVNLSFTAIATDSDLPADTLTFSLDAASLALGMTIDANTGVFSWTPTEAQGGLTPSVTVTVTDDGTGNLVDSETFTITVVDINITPTVSDVAINSVEDGLAVTGSFAVTDADTTDTHTFTLIGTPSEGSVINNGNGTFTFDPGTAFQDLALGETRNVSFTYTATDDSGAGNATSTTATVTVTVTGTNDTPSAGNVAINATEDSTTVTGSFIVSDVDATDTHTFAITSPPGEGTVLNNGNGTFTFDPGLAFQDLALGETRDVTFSYTATDDSGALNGISISATVTVTVAGTNDAPDTTNSIITTNEDVSYTFTAADFSFSDIDGDVLAGLGITSLETAGSLRLNNTDISLNQFVTKADIDNGRLTYIPAVNANGVGYDSFGFRVHDGTEYSDSAYTVTLDVTPVNDVALGKPVITGSFEEGQVLTADTSAISDIDGLGAFSYQWYADGAIIAAATSGSYTLVNADVGSNISVAVSFTDAQGSNESVTSAAVNAVAKEPDQETVPPKTDPIVIEETVAEIEDPVTTDPVTEATDPVNTVLNGYNDLSETGTGWIRPDEIPDYDVELYSDAPRTYEFLKFDVRPIIQSATDITEEMLQLFDLVRIKLGELDDQPGGVFIKSIGTVSASLSVGVVAWVMRGGSVLISMLSSVSVMKGLDPMPLLERRKARKNGAGAAGTDEDERLDELFDGDIEKEESANTESGKEDCS